jgi:hypothetical protein
MEDRSLTIPALSALPAFSAFPSITSFFFACRVNEITSKRVIAVAWLIS